MAMDMQAGPEWKPDEDVLRCGECSYEFSVFTRRHHCRLCGDIFCDTCTLARLPAPHLGYGLVVQRCCDQCVRGMLAAEEARAKLKAQLRQEKDATGRAQQQSSAEALGRVMSRARANEELEHSHQVADHLLESTLEDGFEDGLAGLSPGQRRQLREQVMEKAQKATVATPATVGRGGLDSVVAQEALRNAEAAQPELKSTADL